MQGAEKRGWMLGGQQGETKSGKIKWIERHAAYCAHRGKTWGSIWGDGRMVVTHGGGPGEGGKPSAG